MVKIKTIVKLIILRIMKKIIFIVSFAFFAFSLNAQEKITLSGDYESIMGRMDPLSCYCYNGGYLSFGKGSTEKICFDNLGDVEINNGYITVTGYYHEEEHEQTPNDPCPEGKETIFIVTSYSIESENTNSEFDHWNGIWETNFGDITIKISDYNVVSGYYEHKNGKIKGTVNETMEGSMINGKWTQSDGSGWFTFFMHNGDYKNFSGEWGYYENDGSKKFAEGEWNGNK